jgi:hypothetical protein
MIPRPFRRLGRFDYFVPPRRHAARVTLVDPARHTRRARIGLGMLEVWPPVGEYHHADEQRQRDDHDQGDEEARPN